MGPTVGALAGSGLATWMLAHFDPMALMLASAGLLILCLGLFACAARLYAQNLESFLGIVFVEIGSLDNPGSSAPRRDIFTKHRLGWQKPLDLPQFTEMPS